MDKCLLIFDMASSHISESSLDLIKKLNINYLTIPSGMTSYCQPLDISVNKIFKDNKRILFEKNRLFYDNNNLSIKLDTARLILVNHIKDVWYNDNMIKSNIIINGFLKVGITGNSYLSNQEEKIINNCIYDMGINKEMEILDDLADEIENKGYPNKILNDDEDLENNNNDINKSDNYKNELDNLIKEYPTDQDYSMDIE